MLDGVPDDRVAAIGEILRAALEAGLTGDQAQRLAKQLRVDPDLTRLAAEPVRRFASAGTLSAEPDLAERSDSAHRTTWHGRVILVDTDVRAGRYTLIESLSADLDRVAELVEKYDDLPLGTVDASVIALAERLNITP